MVRCSHSFIVAITIILVPSLAWGEDSTGPKDRPRGFMIEVDLAASTPVYSEFMMELGMSSIVPRLALGAQIGPVGFGLRTGISMFNITDPVEGSDGDKNKWTSWMIRLGPHVDGEIWGSGAGALYLYGGIDVLLYIQSDDDREDDEMQGIGFSVDFGIGGRLYVARVFSIGLQVGTFVDATFWEFKRSGDEADAWNTVVWNIYGALAFRFVASK